MDAKHLPLDRIADGDLVLVNWDGQPMYGIKASNDGDHFVCVLKQKLWDVPGPLLEDNNPDVEFVTLGPDWTLDYEPDEIQFGQGRIPLGSLRFTEDGAVITCHHRKSGRCGVTTDGVVVSPGQNHPSTVSWRLLQKYPTEEYRQVLQWPPENNGE